MAEMMIAYKSPLDLQSPQSIMAFDRWASPGSGTVERRGGSIIDEEALRFLRKLYPPLPSVFSTQLVNSQQPGWRENIGHIIATKRYNTAQTENIITGLNRLDMGISGNFRINSFVQTTGNGYYDVVQGCWADTHIIDASCDVMSFAAGDTRVQAGREEYRNWKPNGPTSQDIQGVTLSKRIKFARPWKKTPKVVAFICGLDYLKGRNIRCNVIVPGELIGTDSFTIKCEVWAGKLPKGN